MFRRLLARSATEKVEKFSENGKTVELTELEGEMREIEKDRPSLFSEKFRQPVKTSGGKGDDDQEIQKLKDTYERYSEEFPKGVQLDTLVSGFKAEQKHNPKIKAEDYLENMVAVG